MALASTVKESQLVRRVSIQKALLCRLRGDRTGMLTYLNHARCEVMNQRYFLGPAPF